MRKGFTLIEIIIIVVIIAILAIVTIPRLMRVSEVRTHMAQRKVAADLRYAHEYAINHNRRTKVSFDVANNTYTVKEETSPGQWEVIEDPTTREDFIVALNTGEYSGVGIDKAIFDQKQEIIFDTIGIPYIPKDPRDTKLEDIGSVVMKESQVAGGREAPVYVDPDTGRVYFWTSYYYS